MNIKQIIREEMDGLDWIKDEELPILPYIGKRFKLIRDDGQDSGRRYQILEYYFEDEYNKDFYIKSIILNPETLKPRTETPTRHKDLFHTPLSRAMELINNGNWVFLDTINESQDDFDWVDDPDIPLRPYPGEEYIWIGWGKNSYTGVSKRSIRFGTKLSDVIRIRHVDEPPLTGVYFESVDDKYNRDMTNIETWNRLVRSGKIIPLKGMGINESQDGLDWIRDSEPIEVIDLNDQWHVNTIKVGDKLEITGEYDDIEFHNEPCEVICVGLSPANNFRYTCSNREHNLFGNKWNTWEHAVLISFEREFYSQVNDEETHCGPDINTEIKCNCREVDGAINHDGEPFLVGTCWWVNIPSLDEVVRINVGDITESEKILESLFNKLSILTEDGKTEPDMEWDFTKGELDKSKRWVKTKEDVKKYLTLLFDKMKRIPKKVKLNILKYVLASFIGIITFTELQQMVDEVSPEKIELNFTKKEKPKVAKKPEVVKNVNVRKPSSKLYDFLRDEEKLRTTAYDIGDGHITIGYGHAERGGETDMVAGKTKISKEKAEELLKQDVEIQTKYLNRILRQWEEKGIKPEITQGMYDSMISLMFNMGYGNFRKADFVQDIKKGDFKTAKEKIRKTHITYPGHKPRREKESQMFDLP